MNRPFIIALAASFSQTMGNINAKDSSLLEDASAENIDDDDDAVVAIDDAALNDRDLEQNNNDDDDDNDSNISKLLAKQEFAEMCEAVSYTHLTLSTIYSV